MASKLQTYSQMAERSAEWVTQSRERWTSFLETAARLYKYPYNEQLMIYAQRPDARACAEMELWNKTMHRWVKRGAKAITLIDASGDKPRLKYVFDVSDTVEGRENPRRPYLWELREEHAGTVMAALSKSYGDRQGDLGTILHDLAGELAEEYWNNHRQDILQSMAGSHLEDYGEFDAGIAYCAALKTSIAYTVMARCGISPGDYLDDEDFLPVFDCNTPDAVAALGTGVSELSEQVLREIEVTVKRHDRQKLQESERSAQHGQPDIPAAGGLPDTQPDLAGPAGRRPSAGQVRPAAENPPANPPDNLVQFPAAERAAIPTPAGDRRGGQAEAGAAHGRAGAQRPAPGRRPSAGQGDRPGGVGAAHGQPAPPSGGSGVDGAGVQVEPFPTGQEQRETIAEASASAVSISDAEIDALLRQAVENPEGRARIQRQFEQNPRSREAAALLKQEYSRLAFTMPRPDGQAGHIGLLGEDRGVTLTMGGPLAGELADWPPAAAAAVTLPWPKVQQRVARLVEAGQFLTAEAPQQAAQAQNPAAAMDFTAADLKTERNDVMRTLDSIFYTQANKNEIIALLDENASNSDICLHLSSRYSGMTVIKAEPGYSVSVVTTGAGIENTLINRLIAWEEIAPVVRSLGMQWKAEQAQSLEAAPAPEPPQAGAAPEPRPEPEAPAATVEPEPQDTPEPPARADSFTAALENYRAFEQQYPGAVIAMQHRGSYMICGDSALQVRGPLERKVMLRNLPDGSLLHYTALPVNREAEYLDRIRAATMPFVMVAEDGDGRLYPKHELNLQAPEQAAPAASVEPETPAGAAPEPEAPATPRFVVKTVSIVQQITSNPRTVNLPENTTAYGIFDTARDRYVKTGDGVYVTFGTEPEAAAHAQALCRDAGRDVEAPAAAPQAGAAPEPEARQDDAAYHADDLKSLDPDLRDVLEHGLLTPEHRAGVARLLDSGAANDAIAAHLSTTFSGVAETMALETGEDADYFATPPGLEVNILDRYGTRYSYSWNDLAPVVRGLAGEWRQAPEQAAPQRPEPEEPALAIAAFVQSKLRAGEKFTSKELFEQAAQAYGDTMADNAFTPKDAYDAMELGVNRHILASDALSPERMLAVLDLLPTQTRRTTDMEKYQQFSTPPSIAYLANYAANVGAGDIMLEPSAGTGGIAVFAKKDGAKVFVNELDKRRLEVIKNLPFDGFFNEDAEQINNIHGDKLTPTVIVMNPPFSSSAQRNIHDTKIGAKHIEESLKMLASNGRLVAIVGQGMADDAPAFRDWWREIKRQYNVKANIGIDGKNYSKYGTNFGIQLLVIDKDGATIEPVQTAFVENLLDLQTMLEGIRHDRPSIATGQDSRDEQHPVTAARSGAAARRGPQRGPSDAVLDTGGGPDTGAAGDRRQPTGAPAPAAAVGGTPGPSPGRAGVHDDGQASVVNGERHGGNDAPNDGDGGAGRTGAADRGQPAGRVEPVKRQPRPVKTELSDSIFERYEPQPLLLENVQPHPANISESAAMSAIEPPPVTYKPSISQDIIKNGVLSDVQLEAVTYAGQSHSQTLPSGYTRGFFLGDGTGVGKGRTITGVILDNYMQGRKKAVWLSENRGLVPDAKRDVKALFGSSDSVVEFQGGKKADASLSADEGILFVTYSALSKGFDQSGSNFEKIVNWLGKDFDGVIVFDEAHNMANSIATKGNRGIKKASQRGMAGLAIQEALPKAKIIYSSATGATEVENLRYAERLGLWGEGTAFPNGDDFVHKIKAGGLAAMELIARDMKAMGVYLSRNISYEDVVYDKIVHELTPQQRQVYDELARSWQIVLQNLNQALKTTNQNLDGMAKGKAYGAFWSAEQRFFNQILTAMQVPSMIADMEKQLEEGNSIVVQLVSTNEAAQEREFARLQEQDLALEDFDLTPKQMLMSYIESSFPTVQFEEYMDDNGNIRSKPVYDSEGNPVINREAVRQKEMLLDKLGSIKVPASALDMVINHFGSDMVAENTGRKRRVVVKDGKAREENIASKKEADVTAFQDGDKRIIVFSKAGGTGKSYHADKSAKNQQHRVHYLLQAGWQADAAVQGFGRSHRSNQVSAPTFVLVTTDLKGQMRFISTIAKRLDQLGALTKGQRQTGSQGLFTAGDNLENAFAADVLALYYKALIQNSVHGVPDGISIIEKLGLKDKLLDEYGQIISAAPELREVNKFLNRILSLESREQNAVFEGYAERLQAATERALQDGTLDKGLENYRADKIVLKEAHDIRADETTGATTKYYSLIAHHKVKPLRFNQVNTQHHSFVGFYQNENTGAVRAVFKTSSTTDQYGNITDNYRLTGQDGNEYIPQNRLENNWEPLTPETAKELWNEAVKGLPEYRTSNLHLIGGTVLPVWDKLPTENVRIYRVLTSDGEMLIGRVIPESMIDATLYKLGATREKETIQTEDLLQGVKRGDTVYLENGWRITQRRVSNEPRIEVMGPDYLHSDLLAKKGVFTERISYQTRYFIPAEKDTIRILDDVLKISPVQRIESGNERAAASHPSVAGPKLPERVSAKSERPSVLAKLKQAAAAIPPQDKGKAADLSR